MDLDAQLKRLHDRVQLIERLVDPKVGAKLLELAAGTEGGASPADVADLKTHVAELAEAVTAVQKTLEGVAAITSDALAQALEPLKGQIDAVGKLADPAVIDLLDWLARNREGLTALLSLGDEDPPRELASTSGSGSSGGSGAAGGAGTEQAGS